jgi:hypothetical protein
MVESRAPYRASAASRGQPLGTSLGWLSTVSPTETAHLHLCTYLVRFTPPRQNVDSGVMMNIHAAVKTRERSRLSQERLKQLMHVRISDVSRSNITEKQLLL